MDINVGNAAKLFFHGTSLESVYIEAVANSMDAGADEIIIAVEINSFSEVNTFKITITDNGRGFINNNFEKFGTLLENQQEKDHKGIGRLAYLSYFQAVKIDSVYEENGVKVKREFIFDEKFKKEIAPKPEVSPRREEKLTKLYFSGYNRDKIYEYSYVKPDGIKRTLLEHFYPKFYQKKLNEENLIIKIHSTVNTPNIDNSFTSANAEININTLPNLKEDTFTDQRLAALDSIKLLYSVKVNSVDPMVITGICVDGRSVLIDVIPEEEVPKGYDIIFLLYSDFFTGNTNPTRQQLTLADAQLRAAKKIFADKVSEYLKTEIPEITERNKKINEGLAERFPHLQGYFEEKSVGFLDRSKSLEVARQKFFIAQKEILDTDSISLTNEVYIKTLELASRSLTEYILFRNFTINKLKSITDDSLEKDIHNIIAPMKSTFHGTKFMDNLYITNAWLMDDKYMSYTKIFSDEDIGNLITEITKDDTKDGSQQPDIAIIFSKEPATDKKADVIIIELKRTGLDLERKNDIVVQLTSRARKLLEFYPDKIQRIWFYGIIDIDRDFKLLLKGQGFTELYSNDTVLFNPSQNVYLDDDKKVPIEMYIQSFKAFVEDAETRNSTFLNILKSEFVKKN